MMKDLRCPTSAAVDMAAPLSFFVGRLKKESNFRKRFSLTQIPTDCKVIGDPSELK